MKKIKYIAFLMALTILGSSCGENFLDLSPQSNANEKDFYRNKAEIETAMLAAYATLHSIYGSLGPMYYFGALSSDDAYTVDRGYEQFENIAVKANNAQISAVWNQFYDALARINNILDKLEGFDFKEKESYAAEMKFLRALYYFNMTQMWGGVPLVTKKLSIPESYQIGRATTEQMYTLIIDDLKAGIEHLPFKADLRAKGAASKGAAYALLGKVYLTMGDKENAEKTLLNIYNKEYKLADTYADLWDLKQKNGPESIFEIQYVGATPNASSTYWALYSPADNLGAITLQGGGHNQVTEDLWNDYEPGDPRREISIQDGWTTNAGKFDATRFPIKWVDHTKAYNEKREASDNNFIVLRYADVLLMLSEATGDPKYLNEVRERVKMPCWGTPQYPLAKYPTLDRAIEHERHVELAMEFHRFFDLKRTGRAVEVLKNSAKNVAGKLDGLTENALLWPIPETVIDQNPAFWKPQQNPGY